MFRPDSTQVGISCQPSVVVIFGPFGVRCVLLHPEQEFVLRHRRDWGEIGVLEGNSGYHRLLPGIRCAEDHLVWVASERLAIGVPFGPAAASFVDDDDGLIGQFVFDDDALNRPSEIVSAAAGPGGSNELNWLAR